MERYAAAKAVVLTVTTAVLSSSGIAGCGSIERITGQTKTVTAYQSSPTAPVYSPPVYAPPTTVAQTATFDVRSPVVTGNAKMVYSDGSECIFAEDVTCRTGDPVVLRDANYKIITTSILRPYGQPDGPTTHDGEPGACAFSFDLKGIPADQPLYQLAVGTLGPVNVSEYQLRRKYFRVRPRNWLDGSNFPSLTIQADDG